MKKKNTLLKVIGLVFGISAIICIAISMILEINNYFLIAGLSCNLVALIILIIVIRDEKINRR